MSTLKCIFKGGEDPNEYNCISTLSGGIDSTVVAHRLMSFPDEYHKPMFVYVSYGTVAEENEIRASLATAKRLNKSLYVLDLPIYQGINYKSYILGSTENKDDDAPFWLEGRNANIVMALATIASLNEIPEIYLGINFQDNCDDTYPDTDERFVCAINCMLASSFKTRIRCIAPLLDDYLDKSEVIEEGNTYNIDWVKETYSCSSKVEGSMPCCDYENCNSCNSRKHDFANLNWTDPFAFGSQYLDKNNGAG